MRKNYLSLLDLKNKLTFIFDTHDDEVSASLYFEFSEVPDQILNRLEVVAIDRDAVVCRLSEFIREEIENHPKRLRAFCEECARDEMYIDQFFGSEDISDDGGNALWAFIEYDLYDYLTGRCG